jgi:hypothetical protein
MLAQDPLSKDIIYHGMVATPALVRYRRQYRCCFWNCPHKELDVRFDENRVVYIYHRRGIQGRGPIDHQKFKPYYGALWENLRHCYYILARCPTCQTVTTKRQLVAKAEVHIFRGRIVFEMPTLRLIVNIMHTDTRVVPSEIVALLGPTPQTVMVNTRDVTPRFTLSSLPLTRKACAIHIRIPHYPIYIFTRRCPQCRTKHGLLSTQDESHSRTVPSKYTRTLNNKRSRVRLWCFVPPPLQIMPYNMHRPASAYPVAERPYWYCYAQDDTNIELLRHFERDCLDGHPLTHLVRQQNAVAWKYDCILETPTLASMLCGVCLKRNAPPPPCCKMCQTIVSKLSVNDMCDTCDKIFLAQTAELAELHQIPSGIYPEITIPATIPIATIAASKRYFQQNQQQTLNTDPDDLVRCYNCRTVHLFYMLIPFTSDQRSQPNILCVPEHTVYYCMNCVKKCRQCNQLLKYSDPMQKCKRCCLGRHRRKNYTVEQYNPRIQRYTLPGSVL